MGLFDFLSRPNVRTLEKRKDVRKLLRALKHKDVMIRVEAGQALGRMGKEAVELLLPALKDPDDSVCGTVARALGEIGDNRAVYSLLELLEESTNDEVRHDVAYALTELRIGHHPRLVEYFQEELKNTGYGRDVRRQLAGVNLLRMYMQAEDIEVMLYMIADADYVVLEELLNRLSCMDKAEASLIARALNSQQKVLREKCAFALGAIGLNAIDPILDVLSKGEPTARESALYSLYNMGVSIERSLKMNARSESTLRLVRALRDPAVIQSLLRALRDSHEDVRVATCETLGQIADRAVIQDLATSLDDSSWRVRAAAVTSIGMIGDRACTQIVCKALEDKDERVRKCATNAMQRLG